MPVATSEQSDFRPVLVPDLAGGLNTKLPATKVPPSQSPDLQNVTLRDGAVGRRGGFVPMIRRQPKANAIENIGFHSRAINNDAGFVDGDFLSVAGSMLAGHRQIQQLLVAEYTIEFFLRIDDLTLEHGGNAADGLGAPGANAPYDLRVRPILFKGPCKKTENVSQQGPTAGADMAWTQNVWGPTNTTDAMPYGIYLFNNAGTWEFRFSAHTRDTGAPAWQLRTVVSSTVPVIGRIYHIIAAFNAAEGRMRFRIGQLGGPFDDPTYTQDDTTWATAGITSSLGNSGPIQVFDCPQTFIETTNVGTSTVAPGLNLGGNNDGGYHFACKRFEGAIEDIAMHDADLIPDGSNTALDRHVKYDPEDLPTTVQQYWSMTEPGEACVKEMRGHGNHLFFCPSGPLYDGFDGSPNSAASWWFNGQNSYAVLDLLNNPNWRDFNGITTEGAAWATMVRQNKPHGIEVTFWPDAIEPGFEQVVAEAHVVLRIAIEKTGEIVGYCMNGAASPAVPQYQATRVASGVTITPGMRYQVALLRTKDAVDGDALTIIVNGASTTQVGLTPASNIAQPPGGVTVGMGAYRSSSYTADITAPVAPDVTVTANAFQLNTDQRSGFIGRVESFRVLAGSATQIPLYKDEGPDDWSYPQSRLWERESTTQTTPDHTDDLVSNVGPGHVIAPSGDQQNGYWLRYAIDDTDVAPSPDSYVLIAGQAHSFRLQGDGGMDTIAREQLTYHTFMRWTFDVDDRQTGDCGRFVRAAEIRNEGGSINADYNKAVHIQDSIAAEQMGVAGTLQKRCVEPDWFSDDSTHFVQRRYSSRLEPYRFKSPREVRPRWIEGLAFPRAGQVEVAALADMEREEDGERFLIMAARRQLYWVRSQWREATPFASDPVGSRCLWSFGAPDSHIVVPGTSANQELTNTNDQQIDVWLYPQDLDGLRLIAYKGDPDNQTPNYMVWSEDGFINVLGSMAGTTAFRLQTSEVALKVNAWNLLQIRMADPATLTVYIDGQFVAGAAVAGYDAFNSAANIQGNENLYLLGLPYGEETQTISYAAGGSSETFVFQGWKGYVTEFRARNVIDTALIPTLPLARFADSAATYYLLHLNDGSGWAVADSAGNTGTPGTTELDELVLIHEGLEESTGRRYDFVGYRNGLYLTNGLNDPLRINFRRFTHPNGPFLVRRLGIEQPAAPATMVKTTELNEAGTPTPPAMGAGIYDVWVAFVDEDGIESEPTLLVSHTKSGGTVTSLRLIDVPRSPDPQVVARQFYMSATGGGSAIKGLFLPDNTSRDVDISPPSVGDGIEATGRRQPAPRARHIAVSQGSVWLGHLPDAASGQNIFAVSDGLSPTWWPGARRQVVDSEDGKPITAIRPHLSRVYLFKRDSIWQVTLVGDTIPVPQLISKSIGLAGGVVNYDNLLYGAGDKGLHRFTGASTRYESMGLENDYLSLLDLDDEGLDRFFGAYYLPDSQYWLSVRERGDRTNHLVYVMQTDHVTQIHAVSQQPWMRMVVPEHSFLGTALDIATREVRLLLGTTSGQVLVLDASNTVDGAPSTGTLTGTATATSTTSLTMAGAAFDTIGFRLKGAVVRITDGVNVYERTIEANTATTLTWLSPIAGLSATPTFEIGSFHAYWSSPWMAPQRFGSFLRGGFVDLEFAPAPYQLTVETIAAVGTVTTQRAFPSAGAESHHVNMADGWATGPERTRDAQRGRYFRMRFGQRTPLQTFSVSAWQLRARPSGQRGGKSAT